MCEKRTREEYRLQNCSSWRTFQLTTMHMIKQKMPNSEQFTIRFVDVWLW